MIWKEEKMIRRMIPRLVMIPALALCLAAPMMAQQQGDVDQYNPKGSPAIQKATSELGHMAIDYWQPKLNQYKVRIDQLLSPADLETLNRLRVRFSVLVSEQMRIRQERVVRQGADNGSNTEVEMSVNVDGASEALEIYMSAKELAERYRGQLDELGTTVLTDFTSFADAVVVFADKYAAEHRAELAADKEGAGMLKELDNRKQITKGIEDLKSEEGQEGLKMAYAFAIEPIVLLYNGSDLREMLGDMLPAAKTTGIELPASSLLAQNFPNPASTTTTIGYKLNEPSSATTLRIYDAKGTIVQTIDEGSRDAGDHQVRVDVASLASGSYLYHLTIQTARGQQVFAKTMQVVR